MSGNEMILSERTAEIGNFSVGRLQQADEEDQAYHGGTV